MAERFKHDPAIPRVKITRQDLKDGLENTNSKSKDGDRNTTKNIKYGSQPYKPGEGTLRKREIEIKLENENILEKSGNSSKNERKSKNRRPDQKIYQVKKATEGRNSVELKIDECLVVDNHEKKEKFKGGISNKCRNALIQKPSVCLFGIEDEKVSKKTENSNLVNSRVKNGVFDGENGARQADRRGRPYRTRSMCSRSSNERCEEPLEKTLENGLKISNETSSTTSWADEMEREDEQKNLQKPLKPEAKHHNTTPKPEPKYIKPEPKYPITKSHRPHTEKRFDRKPLTNGTTDRISPDGKPEPKTPILDETEQNDHQNSDQSSLFEMADVESCSSPPKNPKRKIKTKKRRPKSESSTDEKSPAKNADRREKNNQNTSKGGGILHLPTGRPPSAPMQPTMVFTGNLYNPNNPAQPKAVYRPIQGDQRHEVPVHAAIGSCYSEHGRGSSNTYNNFAYQQHPEPMNWRVRGPDGGSMNMSKSAFINKNMFEATQCEQDIGRILSMSFERMDLISLNSSRFAVQMRYETIILQDIEYSAEVNIEQLLWKAVFYQVIEAFRKQMVDNPSFKEKIKQTMLQIIDEAVLFYESLLEKLQEKYGFNLSIFLDCEVAVRPKMQVLVKKALMSAQKMIISLGDLARYKELANETLNYKKAKNLYLKAQQLAPKNGRPYNQLAILALYERRKLDAVYYYMRSLSASNPFLSAKEGLNQVFDDAKKKYEQVEKLRLECQNAKQVKEKKKDGPEREEVWFLPDGASAINSENSDDDSYDDLGKLSTVDLNKKFILSFLHAHGRLFTKIEIGFFFQIAGQLLREFTCLLRMSPLPLNSTRLVQLMAINMFTINHTEGTNLDPECQALLQNYALQLSFEMFRLLVDRATNLLRNHPIQELSNIPEDLNHLLPAIKVWCDWLIINESVWNRPRPVQITEFRNSGDTDPWTLLAEFFSLAKKMNVKDFEKSSNQKNEDWEPVTLPEDATLAGFEPLLNMPQEVFYLPKKIDKELARNGFRFLKFIYTADFLCGIKLQVMEYDVRDKTFKLHVDDKYKENGIEDGQVNGIQKQPSLSQEEDGVCGENSETSKVVTGSGSSEIEKLKSRKEELTRKKADQERHQQEVQAVLSDTNAIRKRFEIHPDYIIADTNCFIDHLEGIKKLVATDHFRLQVPLVVVNELDGLSKGCDVMRDDQHNSKVVIGAKAALEFLSKIFTPPCHPKVMCVTAQGNVLKTLQFTSESYFGQNRDCNDDIILDCCKTHCRDDGIIKDNVQHFVRNAILLTDDRALRVKAVNSDVPTRDIQKFLLLMRIS